uniref:Reverse transcriptase domain-containing protein n=1 Tax=Tanacetum cinerariifolium TaxID=118510 RepID=A0A699GZ73_TANCI|nr:reverse transcriptase domain-containing protein [Tanacetum cinerariifolium]
MHDSSGMFLSQRKYATEILKQANIVSCKSSRTLVDTESKLGDDGDLTLYLSLAGSLQYLTFTRLTISYAVHQLRNLLRELHTLLSFATLVYYDNVSDVYLPSNLVQHQRMKHIEIDIHFVRDLLAADQNQPRPERKQDRFTLLTKTPKEIFALDKGKFKALPPMTTPVEKQNHAKFWEDEAIEGPMIIEAEIGGHCIHRMYVDGRGRDVLRVHSQHQGTESVSRQGRRCPESSIPKMFKRRTKVKQKARKPEQVLSQISREIIIILQIFEKIHEESDFYWTTEAKEAFKQMKQLIAELPMLTALVEKDELIIFLAAAKETVSAVLMTKRDAKQMPIYYVSRALRGLELNYTSMEKLVLALANVDSRLLANQVNETYIAKKADIIRYLENIRTVTSSFKAFSIRQVPRSENRKADALSKIASTSFAHLSKQVLVEKLKEKSISKVEILVAVAEEGDTWMTPIFEYLMEETLPSDVKEARAVRRKNTTLSKAHGVSLRITSGVRGFSWWILILVIIPKMILHHSKLFEGYVVYLGEDPIWASKGRPPSQRGGCTSSALIRFGMVKLTTFAIMCRAYESEPTVNLLCSSLNLGCAGDWLTLSNRGCIDDNQCSPSSKFVNNESSVIDVNPLTSVHPSNFVEDVADSNDASTGDNKNPLVRKMAAQASKVASKASDSIDDDSDHDIHKFPLAKEVKDSVDCHWVVAHVTPPSWKKHLHQISIKQLCDIYDRAYMRQVVLDNMLNSRTRELISALHKATASCDAIRARELKKDIAYAELERKCNEALLDMDKNLLVADIGTEIETLHGRVDGLYNECTQLVLEEKKWINYDQTLFSLQSKIEGLKSERERETQALRDSIFARDGCVKARSVVAKVVLDAATKLIRSDEMGMLVAKLVKASIIYGRCAAFEEVAKLKDPFVMEKMDGYRPSSKQKYDQHGDDLTNASYPFLFKYVNDPYAFLEQLLSKKPESLRCLRM